MCNICKDLQDGFCTIFAGKDKALCKGLVSKQDTLYGLFICV